MSTTSKCPLCKGTKILGIGPCSCTGATLLDAIIPIPGAINPPTVREFILRQTALAGAKRKKP